MKRDFRTWIVLLAFSLPVLAILFIGLIYLSNCGLNNNCSRGDLAAVIHTPMPTLVPATLPATGPDQGSLPGPAVCSASARTILAAWVSSGASQDQPFSYTDPADNNCTATYADIQILFTRSNLWYPGALACSACHNPGLGAAAAGLDLSSYSGLRAGSPPSGQGLGTTDILGGGNWAQSRLYQALFVQKQMPANAPQGELTDLGPLIQAGQPAISAVITPTTAGVEEVPEPSNPGSPGQAIDLAGDPVAGATLFISNCGTCHGVQGTGGVPNPGSNDGTVPPLNPIDPLLKDPDPKVFGTNIDLFIQNGSIPEGPAPFRNMPGWGNQNALTQQQIADLIAYVISLNK